MADSGNSKIICAICYEEAKPACEDLQSISLCGHVFHELCLQQWLEYCPRGKYTCPLCKQQCIGKDVHRLYFQSAIEATQACQESCSGPLCNGDDVETLRATVQKLTGQFSVTKSSLEAHQEQLQESNRQLSLYIQRAEKAEHSQAEANKEKSSLKDAVSRIQEELKRSTAERCKLLERNTLLTKELASANLTQNLDVDEDDVARMARVGCNNKDDVINTLTKSLIVRNRAYKDLMAKCNELGTGENKALRQCEKASERIRALKARVIKLDRCLEDKENEALSLRRASPSLSQSDPEPLILATKKMSSSLVTAKPPLPLKPSFQVKQMSGEPAKVINGSNVFGNASYLHNVEVIQPEWSKTIKIGTADQPITKDLLKDRGGGRDSVERTSEEYETAGAQKRCNKLDMTASMLDMDPSSDDLSRSDLPATIRKEVRLSASTLSENSTTTSIRDTQMWNSKWCKQSSTCGESSSGTFISIGANGRGGQMKILRPPPMLKVGGTVCDNWLRSAKKMKSTRSGQQAGNQQGSLQIEHFFGGS